MNILRLLVFFPICILALAIIQWVFANLMFWLMGLKIIAFLILTFFFGGLIWGIFKALSAMFIALTSSIAPNKNISFWTVTVLSILNGLSMIYSIWSSEGNYSKKMIFVSIIFTIMVIELTFALILGAASALKEKLIDEQN